jgi:WD40 repeat protein
MKWLVSVLLLSSLVFAEGTRTWDQNKYEDFEKGTAKGVAIRSDGSLELAPTFKPVFTSPSTYIWSIVADPQGNIFAAAGSPARVYRINAGKATIVFAPPELQVQALALADDGTLFAATSPDGRVYKITRKGTPAQANQPAQAQVNTAQNAAANEPGGNRQQASLPIDPDYSAAVFFEPKTKYIWDLALDPQGRLYVATGDNGEIFRVDRSGQGGVFFKSDEAHIRTLAIDNKQNLIAGSDGSGLIYRISPNGEGFVLYSAPKKEITALAVDQQGNIYAAGVGEKRGMSNPAAAQSPGTVTPVQPQQPGLPAGVVVPLQTLTATGGSDVYRIAPDGSPRRIWTSPTDIVYALGFDNSGRLIAGSGNRGRLYSIAADGTFADLLDASANQVTALARAADGGLHVATSNLGKIFDMGSTAGSEGTFESDVFDAHIFSKWGRAQVRGTGIIDLFARSGNVDNPDRNWSAWRKVDLQRELAVDTPPARFIQWRAVLHEGNPGPSLDSVTLFYLPKNVAPVIEDVYVQVGAKFQSAQHTENNTITVGPQQQQQHFETIPSAVRDKNSIAVRWEAHDDNDDELVYSLWYRGDGESRWKLLQDNITDKYYSFDAGLLPDGGYTLRAIASDAPSHTPQDALNAQKEGGRFEVDNTAPIVQNLASVYDGNSIHTTFRAEDSFSVISHAEFSVDAGDWQTVEPVGQISDSRIENYDFTVPISVAVPAVTPNPVEGVPESAVRNNKAKRNAKNTPPPLPTLTPIVPQEEHIVVVRVYDKFENMGSAKVLVRALPPPAPAKK